MSSRYEDDGIRHPADFASAGQELKRFEMTRMEVMEPVSQTIARMAVGFDLQQVSRMMNPTLQAYKDCAGA
jgi:hypothetical protein